jgi:hypothetical protein
VFRSDGTLVGYFYVVDGAAPTCGWRASGDHPGRAARDSTSQREPLTVLEIAPRLTAMGCDLEPVVQNSRAVRSRAVLSAAKARVTLGGAVYSLDEGWRKPSPGTAISLRRKGVESPAVRRDRCRLCGFGRVQSFLTLPAMPLRSGSTPEKKTRRFWRPRIFLLSDCLP